MLTVEQILKAGRLQSQIPERPLRRPTSCFHDFQWRDSKGRFTVRRALCAVTAICRHCGKDGKLNAPSATPAHERQGGK